jgi:hypothetical protein
LDGERVSRLLCQLEPGMRLTAPDAWVDGSVTGTIAQRANRIRKIAADYGCIWSQGDGVQTFEKQEIWATG